MFEAVNDVAEGNISVEELTVALNNAVRSRQFRQLAQGEYHNVPEETVLSNAAKSCGQDRA